MRDQSGCQSESGGSFSPREEVFQGADSSFGTAENGFASLRRSWALSSEGSALARRPYRYSHPLSEVLCVLLSRGRTAPSLHLSISSLPLHELCQLSLLWDLAGEREAGRQLALKLLPLCSFPSLWCPEGRFNESEARFSTALLQRSFGRNVPLPETGDPYLLKLAHHLPSWKEEEVEPFAALQKKGKKIELVEVLKGTGTSLGALRSGDVEIRAFGPGAYPLNDPGLVGATRSENMGEWAAVAADPSIWLRTQSEEEALSFQFVGLRPEKPLSMSLYVAADLAHIEGEGFESKTLRRYRGKAQTVQFKKGESSLAIQSDSLGKMELIPLAGEGCYWNANFLLALEIPCFEGKLRLCLV